MKDYQTAPPSLPSHVFFQAALDAASTHADGQGAVVFVPAGRYTFTAGITVPANVTLQGVFSAPASYHTTAATQGSILEIDYAGGSGGTPFVTLAKQSTIRGLTIYDKRQGSPTSIVPRPWFIRGGSVSGAFDGDSCSIQDMLLVNPYRGIDLATKRCGRHYLRGIYGQPLNLGISVDQSLDTGRIQDVHFWDFWSSDANATTLASATALQLGQCDWQMVQNFFAYRYSRGIHLVGGIEGRGTNGQFSNVMIDQPSVGIDAAVVAPGGVQFSNLTVACEPGTGAVRSPLRWVRPTGTGQVFGPVSVLNGSFWGPPGNDDLVFPPFGQDILLGDGPGVLQVSSTLFRDWTTNAIRVRNQARLIATANYFEDNQGWARNAVVAEGSAFQTIVANNQVLGNTVIISTPYGYQAGNL